MFTRDTLGQQEEVEDKIACDSSIPRPMGTNQHMASDAKAPLGRARKDR